MSACWRRTGRRPIGTRWVDENKGDVHNPEVRCRLVAQEVSTYKEDAFFAATPPLEALGLVLIHVATGTDSRKIMILDAEKAHLHAYAEREMFVELPLERRRPGSCGRLVRSLYGTRDAPSLWEKFAASQLDGLGFIRGLASSWVLWHASRDLVAVVHGDDFVFTGVDADLAWAHCALKENIFPKKVRTLSGDAGDVQDIRVFNRVLRWTAWGIAYEADPRHAELLFFRLWAQVHHNGPLLDSSPPLVRQGTRALSLGPRRGSTEHARPGKITWHWTVWMWHSLPKSFAAV